MLKIIYVLKIKKKHNLLVLWHAWQSERSMAFYLFRGRSLNNLTISFTKRHFDVCVINCMYFIFKFLVFMTHPHFNCFLIFTVAICLSVWILFFRTTEYWDLSPNQFYILHSHLQFSPDKAQHIGILFQLFTACFSIIFYPLLKAILSFIVSFLLVFVLH